MIRKHFFFYLFLILFSACEDSNYESDERLVFNITETINQHYRLAASTFNRVPYSKNRNVIFVDSLNNQLKFKIIEEELFVDSSKVPFMRKDWEKMTATLYYITYERKRYFLDNDTFDYNFSIEIFAEPKKVGYREGLIVRDQLEVYSLEKTVKKSEKVKLFEDIVDMRTWESKKYKNLPKSPFDNWNLLDREFKKVFFAENYNKKPFELIFSYEFGIISFIDNNNKVWRFDQFSE